MNKISPFIIISVLLFVNACTRNHDDQIIAQGIVDGPILSLKSQVMGRIVLNTQDGLAVEEGEHLAQIDARKLDRQLENVKLEKEELKLNRETIKTSVILQKQQLEYFTKQERRFSRLVEQDSLPREKKEGMALQRLQAETRLFELRQKEIQLNLAEQKLGVKEDQLNLQLEDHAIVSPRKGWILETHVESGETVFPGTALFDLMVNDSLTIDIFLEERELHGISLGQKAEVYIDGRDTPLVAAVQNIGRQAEFSSKYIISEKERQSLLFKVTLSISPNPALKIGQPVDVRLQIQGQ